MGAALRKAPGAQARWQADGAVPTLPAPWMARLDAVGPEQEYFLVHTWGEVPLAVMWKFNQKNKIIHQQLMDLEEGKLVGFTVAATPGLAAIMETVTVWSERRHMAEFFKSGAHQEAMTSMKDDLTFCVRRCWVLGSELPAAGDGAATAAFWAKVKQGGFRAAEKATS